MRDARGRIKNTIRPVAAGSTRCVGLGLGGVYKPAGLLIRLQPSSIHFYTSSAVCCRIFIYYSRIFSLLRFYTNKFEMSASGKSLLGLWLYRMGEEEWKMKDSYHTDREVCLIIYFN